MIVHVKQQYVSQRITTSERITIEPASESKRTLRKQRQMHVYAGETSLASVDSKNGEGLAHVSDEVNQALTHPLCARVSVSLLGRYTATRSSWEGKNL
jgi:hypothetical protein